MNDKKNIYKSVSLVLLVLLVLLGGFFGAFFLKNKKYSAKFKEIGNNFKAQELKIDWLSKIVVIDEYVIFDGEYEDALESLNELKNENIDEYLLPSVSKRIQYLEKLTSINNEGEENNPYELILQNNKLTIVSLEKDLDSIQDYFSQKTTSMSSEIISLKDDLIVSKAKSSNTSNDKLKVISFKSESGKLIHYLGEVQEGKANGGGVGVWSTGSLYRGNWKNNKRHGNGTFEWVDGEKYEGEYVNDKRTGEGTYYWPNGEKYKGEWIDDKREGYGILFDIDGNIRFEGGWKNDKPDR